MNWLEKFWDEHGGRLIMMGITLILGALSLAIGILLKIDMLIATGGMAINAVVILAVNKTRSPKNDSTKPE